MKRHWVFDMQDREGFALANWLQNRFTRNKQPVYDPEIEIALDKKMLEGAAKLGITDRRSAAFLNTMQSTE